MNINFSDLIAGGALALSCIALFQSSRKQNSEERTASANEMSEIMTFIAETKVRVTTAKEKLRELKTLYENHSLENQETIKSLNKIIELLDGPYSDVCDSYVFNTRKMPLYDLILLKGLLKSQLHGLEAFHESIEVAYKKENATQRLELPLKTAVNPIGINFCEDHP